MARYLVEEYGKQKGANKIHQFVIGDEKDLFDFLQEGRNRKVAITKLEEFCVIDWS